MNQFNQGSYVFVVSNRFWFHYVYLFSLSIIIFQWIVSRFRRQLRRHYKRHHSLVVIEGRTYEQLAKGQDSVSVSEWWGRANRTVDVYRVTKPLVAVPASKYGYLDIPHLVWHYFLEILGFECRLDHIELKGLFCSEDTAARLGEKKAHLVLPCMVPDLDGLEYVGTFET